MKIYGVNIAEGSTITNLVVASGSTFPELASEGELFYRNDGANEGMYVYDGEEWIQFGAGGAAAAGSLISELSGDLSGTVEIGTSSTIYLAAAGTSGTYVSITTDEKGRVISGTSTQAWTSITSTPTTLAGYGITDAQTSDSNLTSIAGLTGTSGLLKKTAADTWSLDTSTYLISNESIAIAGDATGSGTTSISLTLANTGVSAGRFGDQNTVPVISFDSKGRATSASAVSIGIFASQITGGTLLDERVAVSNVTQHQASLTISESQITDGALLARVAASETISGTWAFNNPVTVATPTSGSHAATKDYVDTAITGLDMKASVRVATTANITLSGTQTIDGVAVVLGNRVLVKDQSTATENGIYVVTGGTWPRAGDADNTPEGEVTSGMYTFVEEGTVNADSGWVLTTNNPITLGTTGLTFVQFNGLGQVGAGAGLTKTGSTLDIASASANRIVVNTDSIDLATVGIPGTYTKVTTDAYGRVTTATALIAADIPNLSATYQPLDADLTAIAGLAGTSGILKKTAADTWSLDTATYLTGNQSITLSGDATGSGSTAISLTLANSGVAAGTFTKVTVDAKGRVTTATTLAAGDIPSLTQYVLKTGDTMTGALTGTNFYAGAGTTSSPSISFSADTNTGIYSPAADTIAFVEGGVEAMRINSNGNIGIRNTAPEYKLDLAQSGSSTSTDSIRLDLYNGPAEGGGTTIGTGILWKPYYSGYTKRAAGIYQVAEGNFFRSGLAFYTNGTADMSTDFTEAMRISGGGNVGIGTTTPGYKLDVAGDVNVRGTFTATTASITRLTFSNNLLVTNFNSGTNASSSTFWRGDGIWSTLSVSDIPSLSSVYQPLDADLTAIGALAGTSGILKKTAANTWSLDTATYLTGNQSITLSGDATGSGATSIAVTLANSGVAAGAYGSASAVPVVTFDSKGRATTVTSTSIAIAASQITSGTLADARVAASNVTQHQASLTIAETQITDGTLLARVGSNETISGTWSFNNAVTVGSPTAGGHAATKDYVDNTVTGLDMKASVRAATTANITLSGTQTIDGVSVIAGDRVLVKNQNTGSENGIYVVAAGAWTRATDADNTPTGEVTSGMYAFVEEGTTNADSGWVLSTNNPITLGTTALTFVQFNGLGQVTAGAGLTKTGNTLDIATASASRIVVNADSIDLATTGVAAGTFTKVTTDAYGRITTATTLLAADIPNLSATYQPLDADLTAIGALAGTSGLLKKTAADTWSLDTATYLTGNQSITISGDATGSGATSIALTLANSGVVAGTFTKVTVDAKGRVTTATTLLAADIPTLNQNTTGSAASLTTGRTISMTGDVTYTSGSFNGSANVTGVGTLANSGVSAGTYTKVTVDAKGRVTTATNLVAGDIPTLTGYVLKTGDTMTGTLTGTNFYAGAGTTSSPSLSFAADNNTGIYNPAADTIGFVEGGVEVMRITSSGNVGINTTSPTQRLDVDGTLRVRGSRILQDSGTANPYEIGSGAGSGDTTMWGIYAPASRGITFSAGGNEAARIISNGRVLINRGSEYSNGSWGSSYFQVSNTPGVAAAASFITTSAGDTVLIGFANANGPVGSITVNGNNTYYNATSDYRLKENIAPMNGALDKIAALKPVTYTWKSDGSTGQGFIAHELAEVMPGIVTGQKDAVNAAGEPMYQAIDQSKLVALLTAAVKELKAELDSLKAQISK